MNAYEIEAGAAGVTAPDAVAPGAVTFRIRSDEPDGAWVGLVRLVEGVPLEQYLDDLRRAYGRGQEAIAASRLLDGEGIMLGGGAVVPGVPVDFSQTLSAGTYHLIDYKRILDEGAPKVHTLTVEEGPTTVPAGCEAEAGIVQLNTAAGPRYRAPERIRAGAPLRVTNRIDQYSEAVLMQVKEGTEAKDVEDFFAAVADGRQPPVPDLLRSGPVGCVPLSPGRSAVVAAELAPGPYVVTSWVTDHDSGRMFGAEGLFALITVE